MYLGHTTDQIRVTGNVVTDEEGGRSEGKGRKK
jgi:hypothetical protein